MAIALYDIAPESLRKKTHYNQEKKSHRDFIADDIPIVVISSYMIRNAENHGLWDHLAKLAATLVENRIAHVIFISPNVGIVKHLNKGILLHYIIYIRVKNNHNIYIYIYIHTYLISTTK